MTDGQSTLLSELDNGILTLTLNRPERLNALDIPLFDSLLAACAAVASDPAVKVLVLRGAGKAFSAGGDLTGAPPSVPLTYEDRVDGLRRRGNIALLLHRMPKPTIGMLRGAVAGGAMSIALGCDVRLASETTKFVPAFARAGFSGDFGISYLLPLFVGQAKAREILFLGDPIDASTAERLGMINQLVADDALEAATRALAERLAAGPSLAYRYMKQNLALSETATFEQSLDIEAANMVRAILSEDGEEAVRAFKEKRAPRFSGR
jgi:2-(1,2-epoxy-1,2-dihydrophenyl)acetyl-CoA isomerase